MLVGGEPRREQQRASTPTATPRKSSAAGPEGIHRIPGEPEMMRIFTLRLRCIRIDYEESQGTV